jgi:uncharacterized protein YndB with AHSA1/START domain
MIEDESVDPVVVRRVIPAPRERVFDAWLDASSLARFMTPRPGSTATAQVDARVGGMFRITMIHGEGAVEHRGEYLAIERPARLSFTWISVNTDHRPTVVTVEFLPHRDGTELVLTHERLPPPRTAAHRDGWGAIAGKLAGCLDTPLSRLRERGCS